ncbi:MAG: hypothetical protein ABIJ45_10690 [Candidatus Zixiibacteriota bacterium]
MLILTVNLILLIFKARTAIFVDDSFDLRDKELAKRPRLQYNPLMWSELVYY